MIELNQKEIEAVSGGTFGIIGKVISFKIGAIQSIFGGHSKPPVVNPCKPPVNPCKPVVVDPCKPTCPPPAPGCDNGPDEGDF